MNLRQLIDSRVGFIILGVVVLAVAFLTYRALQGIDHLGAEDQTAAGSAVSANGVDVQKVNTVQYTNKLREELQK